MYLFWNRSKISDSYRFLSLKSYIIHYKVGGKMETKKISTYNFIHLFCAINVSQNEYEFNRNDLLKFIINSKQEKKYDSIIGNIIFKKASHYLYSDQFDEAIVKLKRNGILWEKSTNDEFRLQISPDISKTIIDEYKNYLSEIICFINEYNNFIDKINNYDNIKTKSYKSTGL